MSRSLYVLAVPLLAMAPAAGRADSVEERLSRLEKRLDQIERLLEVKLGAVPAAPGVIIKTDSHAWIPNAARGTIIRTDKRDGETRVVHTGKPGRWDLLEGSSYCWLLGAGGTIVRIDKRDGETKTVYTGKPGRWEIVSGKDGNGYVVLANADTGAVVRVDKRDGETKTVEQGQ